MKLSSPLTFSFFFAAANGSKLIQDAKGSSKYSSGLELKEHRERTLQQPFDLPPDFEDCPYLQNPTNCFAFMNLPLSGVPSAGSCDCYKFSPGGTFDGCLTPFSGGPIEIPSGETTCTESYRGDVEFDTGCDYFLDQLLEDYQCSLNEYCDFFENNGNADESVCTGSLSGRHELTRTYEEECDYGACFEVTSTVASDEFDVLSFSVDFQVTNGNMVLYEFTNTIRDDIQSCEVIINGNKCNACVNTECSDGELGTFEDCSNIDSQLIYNTCSGDNFIQFLAQADRANPARSGAEATTYFMASVLSIVVLAFLG